MKRAYLDLPYGQMHYRYAGEGEPVILLHMSGFSSAEYELAGDILAGKGYKVYAPDFMGFGNSDRGDHYFSFNEHADSIKAFADALGIKSAYIAGNLVGANITSRIAAKYPELVKKACMFHVCFNKDPEFYPGLRKNFSVIPIEDDGSHMAALWARSHKYGDTPEISNIRCQSLHTAGDWGEALHWALCEDTDIYAALPKVACKARVYAYSVMEHETPRDAAELMQKCDYEFLPDSTPYIARAEPDRYVEKLLEVFEG